jgi:parvulin-like peptidyl-prolyl isomerase
MISMKFAIVAAFLVAAAAQTPPPAAANQSLSDLPPDTVIASFDGKKVTAEEMRKIFAVLPPQNQQGAMRDRKGFVQQYALMQKLAEMAAQDKLDEQSPAKEALAFNRMYILSNAQLTKITQDVEIPPGEYVRFYEANKDRYRQVQLKVIYISFSNTAVPGKKVATEAEAKAKAEKLVAELRAGADFVKLVKLHSEDDLTAKKDGDFGDPVNRTDNLPDAIRSAVFALKQGEISQPVRQPNGYYIFRAEEVAARPLESVKAEIDAQLRDQRSRQTVESLLKSLNIKFENEAFFNGGQPPQPPSIKP